MAEEMFVLLVIAMVVTVLVAGAGIFGWVHTTKLKIRHGYPLQSMWGQPLRPRDDGAAEARVALVTQENARLQAELGAVKDRLATVERIVTDTGYQLTSEIDRLSLKRDAN